MVNEKDHLIFQSVNLLFFKCGSGSVKELLRFMNDQFIFNIIFITNSRTSFKPIRLLQNN